MSAPTHFQMRSSVDLARRFVDGEPAALAEMQAAVKALLAEVPPCKHCLFYGTYRDVGHYLWQLLGGRPRRVPYDTMIKMLGDPYRDASERTSLIPFGHVDGKLVPKSFREGEAILVHKNGWTAIQYWDRSVDTRPGSNSTFLFDAELLWQEAITVAMREFPEAFERIKDPGLRHGPFEVTWRER